MMAGTLSMAVALAWSPVFPVNKKIWTSSFVLLTVGIDLLVLPVLVFLLEIKRARWAIFHPMAGGYLGSLLFALTWTGICWLVGYGLDRRGIYIRV